MLRFAVLLLASTAAFAQLKLEPAGPPPSEVAPDVLVTLSKSGTKIANAKGSTLAEIWMRATAPRIPPPPKSNVTPPGIPSGALVGVLRLPGKGTDMRGPGDRAGVLYAALSGRVDQRRRSASRFYSADSRIHRHEHADHYALRYAARGIAQSVGHRESRDVRLLESGPRFQTRHRAERARGLGAADQTGRRSHLHPDGAEPE